MSKNEDARKALIVFGIVVTITLAIFLLALYLMYRRQAIVFAPYVPTPPDTPYFWLNGPEIEVKTDEERQRDKNIVDSFYDL